MTVVNVSLCTGIGGLDMAAESVLGGRTRHAFEIDPDASRVIVERFPGVTNHGDLTAERFDAIEGPTHALSASYPCQPFSLAGRRKGSNDVRHLWPHINAAIRQLRPTFVVLENVPGHRSLGFDNVLGDLAEIGFDAEWTSVRASDVGAPHRRERLYVLASSNADSVARSAAIAICGKRRTMGRRDEESRAIGLHESVDRWGAYAEAIERWERITDVEAPPPKVGNRLNPRLVEWVMGYPAGWVDVNGLKKSKNGTTIATELRMLGNAVVPQAATLALTQLVERLAS